MDSGRSRYSTRSAVRAGLASPSLRDPPSPRTPPITDSRDGAPQRDASPFKSRPVTPELSFSKVVAGSSASSVAQGVGLKNPELFELPPPLSLDVDYNSLHVASDVGPAASDADLPDAVPDVEDDGNGLWTGVTAKTARSHRSVSPTSPSARASGFDGRVSERGTRSVETTIARANRELTSEQLMTIARCHQRLSEQALKAAGRFSSPSVSGKEESIIDILSEMKSAAEVLEKTWRGEDDTEQSAPAPVSSIKSAPDLIKPSPSPAVSRGEGPSHRKGKGPDPRNWGGVDFSQEFTEEDFRAQQEAFDNYSEINRVIKEDPSMNTHEFIGEDADADATDTGVDTPITTTNTFSNEFSLSTEPE
ncbi:hypothetical protein GGX14DRAFT_562982 [Mycena pura]|uniref:Uncharacterized protein n=1 Tax=Mycena pura TaxID=153505 RepID=A0AAD6VN09_9AGAR|nr:hypothetical protein GGX14DRAFT_562982 [Mycena pura]